MKSLRDSLSLRLFLLLFGVILVAFFGYAAVSIRTTSNQWSETVLEGARQFSDLIKRSTHHGMLLNRKEDVRHIIRTIAGEPGVVGVRIYDKQGVIIYSAEESEIGAAVDLDAEACTSCHDPAVALEKASTASRVRVYGSPDQGRILGLISPIENAPECSTAACHAHPPEQTVLGVLDVKMSLAGADARMATARRQVLVAAVLIAALAGAASAVFIFAEVRRPVMRLIDGTARVAAGDLDTEIVPDRRNEIGRLARAFNQMTRDLRAAREELTRWSDRLERKLVDKTDELNRTQRQVVHMEKMASLGKLAATVAHELNNPLAGIVNYARLVERTIDESGAAGAEANELRRWASLIRREAGRSGDIVRNLLLFARRSGAELAPASLDAIVQRSTMLVRHHLEMANVRLDARPLGRDDELVCDADQLQQALVALLVNAVEAMPDGGTLTVDARAREDEVELVVEDTGSGIPGDVLPHIFEPFFSTKDKPGGVGLGLAVVYGIVQRHGGDVRVDSQVGRGTRFTVVLPRRPRPGERGKEQKDERQSQARAGV